VRADRALMVLLVFATSPPAVATPVKEADALVAARGWVELVTANEGGWFGCKTAQVVDVRPLQRKGTRVGYICRVKPSGYVVLSLYKELSPVKAFSTNSTLDPESEDGMADLIKGTMEASIRKLEARFGAAELSRPEGPSTALPRDYRDAWKSLEADNQQCPPGPTCAHTLVGCVATAAAQIMRYWNWPPFGVDAPYSDAYDWANMLDVYSGGETWQQMDAVAELCFEAAVSVDVNFGCDASRSDTGDMKDALRDHFRMWASRVDRGDYNADEWFEWLRTQFDANMPVEYRIVIPGPDGGGHAIVGDSWKEIGSPPSRYIHFNYGWGITSNNAWYELDDPALGELGEQYAIVYIYPQVSLGGTITGTFARDPGLPYRYVNWDTACPGGFAATFDPGQFVQFLPGVKVKADSTYGPSVVRFNGSDSLATRLFAGPDSGRGVRIAAGTVKLSNSGSITLQPISAPRYVRAFDMSEPPTYRIYVGWERGAGSPDGFVVERRVGLSGAWTRVATPGPTTNGWWDLDLQPSTSYRYRIRATKADGGSEWSVPVSASTP